MDIPAKFWKKYEKSDLLKREQMLKPIVKSVNRVFLIKDEKIRLFALQTVLQSYFDNIFESIHYVEITKKISRKKIDNKK